MSLVPNFSTKRSTAIWLETFAKRILDGIPKALSPATYNTD